MKTELFTENMDRAAEILKNGRDDDVKETEKSV